MRIANVSHVTVYAIFHKDRMIYIGVTGRNLKVRLKAHLDRAKYNQYEGKRDDNPKLYPFIRDNPDGQNYKIAPIEIVESESASDRERFWIGHFDMINNGLNRAPGGLIKGKDHYLYGKPVSRHIVEASVASRIGKKLSDEHREKIRQGNTGKRCDSIAKPVKCETDGKVFRTTKEAAKHYGISPTTITNICQGISSGKLLKLKFSYHGEAN